MKLMYVVVSAAILTAGIVAAVALAQGKENYRSVEYKPQWTADQKLKQPEDFRQLVFIGSPLTPNGLNNGAAGFPEYHNVYTQPEAFESYRMTGKWPEGTMMIKELQLVKTDKDNFEDGSRLEPSGRGYFPAEPNGMDVAVKDSSRFARTNGWGYFNFGHHAPPYEAAAAEAPAEVCASCHIANAHEDMVYVGFYKGLLDALPTPKLPGYGAAPDAGRPQSP